MRATKHLTQTDVVCANHHDRHGTEDGARLHPPKKPPWPDPRTSLELGDAAQMPVRRKHTQLTLESLCCDDERQRVATEADERIRVSDVVDVENVTIDRADSVA